MRETTGGGARAKAGAAGQGRIIGSLRDALAAAGRAEARAPSNEPPPTQGRPAASQQHPVPTPAPPSAHARPDVSPRAPATDGAPAAGPTQPPIARIEAEVGTEPRTQVVRRPSTPPSADAEASEARTTLIRGKRSISRTGFAQDPVVGWLVVIGGRGLGSFRPIFEGNNTIGRASSQRIPIDFGDETISAEEQAYIRYDSQDRTFLLVPNLAKTNIVSVDGRKPTGAVELKAMDVITMGRTQLVFVPFCGPEFDWAELDELRE